MKVVKVQYGDMVLFEGAVEEMAFAETASTFNVAVKLPKPAGTGGLSGGIGETLAELISSASRRKTDAVVDSKRRELALETEPEPVDQPI